MKWARVDLDVFLLLFSVHCSRFMQWLRCEIIKPARLNQLGIYALAESVNSKPLETIGPLFEVYCSATMSFSHIFPSQNVQFVRFCYLFPTSKIWDAHLDMRHCTASKVPLVWIYHAQLQCESDNLVWILFVTSTNNY